MNLSLAAAPPSSSFRGNLFIPLSRCASCFQFDVRLHHHSSNGFRHSRSHHHHRKALKQIRNPRYELISSFSPFFSRLVLIFASLHVNVGREGLLVVLPSLTVTTTMRYFHFACSCMVLFH